MFDPNCWTYWCDDCGREMTINYAASSEEVLVLGCKKCGSKAEYGKLTSGNSADTEASTPVPTASATETTSTDATTVAVETTTP